MKSHFLGSIGIVFGFVVGVVFSGVAMSLSAGNMMLVEIRSPFDHGKTVSTLTDNIAKQPGWHVVSVIDQQKECLAHGGSDIGKFTIVKYCSGKTASVMLGSDDRKRLGAMMPKAFAVYEKSNGQVYVATANGAIMGKLFGGETERIIEGVSLDVESMLRFLNFKFPLF